MPLFPYPNVFPKSAVFVDSWNTVTVGSAIIGGAGNLIADFGRGARGQSQVPGACISVNGHSSGKTYAEILVSAFSTVGMDIAVAPMLDPFFAYNFGTNDGGICWGSSVTIAKGTPVGSFARSPALGRLEGYGTQLVSGVAMIALDMTNLLIWFGLNGAWYGWNGGPIVGDPTNHLAAGGGLAMPGTGTYYIGTQMNISGGSITTSDVTATLRTTASQCAYTPPSGYSYFD